MVVGLSGDDEVLDEKMVVGLSGDDEVLDEKMVSRKKKNKNKKNTNKKKNKNKKMTKKKKNINGLLSSPCAEWKSEDEKREPISGKR
nr:hypothetical protein BaRGS_026774 [Batillaria attramentaria]